MIRFKNSDETVSYLIIYAIVVLQLSVVVSVCRLCYYGYIHAEVSAEDVVAGVYLYNIGVEDEFGYQG